MDSSVERMVQYCSGIAQEFEARLNRIRAYVPDHKPTAGAANEVILRNFLSQLSTGRYTVGQGFICDPCASDSVSRQCDILIYNHHEYPLVYSEGDIKVVFPQSVRMLIEVKTGLTKSKLKEALENIQAAKQMNYLLNGVIFAFKSPRENTVIRHLQESSADLPLRYSPIAILLLNRGVIIHRWPGTELGGGDFPYRVCISRKGTGVVIAFLLLLFFDVLMEGVWGGANIMNMGRKLLDENTETIIDELAIFRGPSAK
jgi:hypothetical protein